MRRSVPANGVDAQVLAAFLSRVAFKRTDKWKEEIVYLDLEPAE